jgi:RNA polymerase sigma-70 factor (ECF subfamily)
VDLDDPMDRLFRRSAGRLLASLTRLLGPDQFSLAEDVVQDALVKALQVWPYHGIPDNPEGWLYRVARNRALDEVRRSEVLARKLGEAAPDTLPTPESGTVGRWAPFRDDELTMMFLCCHPRLSRSMQVCLTLKAVAGFGLEEIAAAFLARPATIEQRLVRAKRILRDEAVSFDMPEEDDIGARLESVLRVIYLLFNEGYGASVGDALVRGELCGEAIRLAKALVGHPLADRPAVHALLALMHLQASRLPARSDDMGSLVVLDEQDRTAWDHAAIAAGLRHLDQAATGDALTTYHVEAGIAACHAVAPNVDETDWPRIVAFYDVLLVLQPTPVVRLNRAVAVAAVRGADAGLVELEGLDLHPSMSRYHLLPAVRAHLLERAGLWSDAAVEYERAVELCRTGPERALLERRLGAAREHV